MPSYRWSYLIAVLCGVGSAVTGTTASAFQYPPVSDDINTRHMHNPEDWVGEGFRSSGGINHSPAEFGPAPGMWQRSFDGSPASGDSFPFMTPGSLPGGLSQNGFNGSGMNPPVNQPPYIANNPAFGGNGQTPFGISQPGQMPFGQNGPMNPNQFGPNQQGQIPPQGWNQPGNPYGSSQPMNGTRVQPKVSWALDTTQQPYVGLLGQMTRPGVYEIEKQGTRLGALIQGIGGLARDASGQFRIIRNGRPGQMTSYAGAAQFELMAGDLVIADAQFATSDYATRSSTNAKPTSSTAVQIGFVNLIDRPVVLKLRREDASVFEILALMRQDENLASQVQVIIPPNQRSGGQNRPDAKLPSETVLIFPQNAVRAARLAPLPEPFKLKREEDDATPPPTPTPRTNISPDVTQLPRKQPLVGAWQDSTPLPQTARPIAQPSTEPATEIVEAPLPPAEDSTTKRAGGVRGKPRGRDLIARDSDMVLAPPAEPTDRAPVPKPTIVDDQPDEPPLLNAPSQRRPIPSTKDELTDLDQLDAEPVTNNAASSWSIWPPILTAGVGLLALIGFSLSLRRRTQTTHAIPPTPPTVIPPKPVRRDALEAIINDELPLTEERVPFNSPMQFHGRPQPPKTIRLDQSHALPKPHLQESGARSQELEVRGQRSEVRRQEPEVRRQPPAAPKTAATATQKFRIDRSGSTGTGTQIISGTPHRQPAAGPLDRALSAVQKQSDQNSVREERDA
ncbi:MAG: SLBB domain-containing protein [Planctomycetaceae bacterium]|nr:SLBB domain-containing protein [Planctomycetaceae bacterium]